LSDPSNQVKKRDEKINRVEKIKVPTLKRGAILKRNREGKKQGSANDSEGLGAVQEAPMAGLNDSKKGHWQEKSSPFATKKYSKTSGGDLISPQVRGKTLRGGGY